MAVVSQIRNLFPVESFPLVKAATASLILFKGNATDGECDGNTAGMIPIGNIVFWGIFTYRFQIRLEASIVFRLC